jgi:hypothetical protein
MEISKGGICRNVECQTAKAVASKQKISHAEPQRYAESVNKKAKMKTVFSHEGTKTRRKESKAKIMFLATKEHYRAKRHRTKKHKRKCINKRNTFLTNNKNQTIKQKKIRFL